jgi:ATP-binding cassette subfamily B protein
VSEQRRTQDNSLLGSWRKARQAPDYRDTIRYGSKNDDDDVRYKPLSLRLMLRLGAWMKPYRRSYIIGTLLGILALGLELTTPKFMQWIVDDAIRGQGGVPRLLQLAAMWVGVIIVALLAHAMVIGLNHRSGQQVTHDLRVALFAQLQRLSMSFYDRTKLGRIITRGTSDLQALSRTLQTGLQIMLSNTLLMIGAGAMILITDWRLFLALVWLIPLLTWLNRRFRRRVGERYQILRAHFSRVASNLAENISGTRIVSAFNRQEQNLDRFNELQVINTVNNMHAANLQGGYQPLLEFMRFIGQAILLTFGGLLVLRGRLTVGTVVAVAAYWEFFMRPTIIMGNFYNQLMMAMASSERVFSLLDMEPEIQDKPGAPDLPPVEGHVRFRDIQFGYDPDRPVLHDIDLDIPAGSTVALVGATGSGKTSILALLARFYDPQQGVIEVDGYDTRTHTMKSLRRQMGMVLQVNYLFTGTVLDNIRYGRPEAGDEEVYEAARQLDIHETLTNLPEGYQTMVGERGAQLSLGVRQLICFARVMLIDPKLLLLDEATSAIDTVTEIKIQEALQQLVRGRTTVIVAHRLSTITKADLIVVMSDGRIVERGTHEQLLDRQGHYAQLYERFVNADGVLE